MKNFGFIVLLLITFVAPQKGDLKLEVGARLPEKYIPSNNRKLYMTHSAQFRPYIEREVGGVKYVIAYDKETHVIKYISTHDQRFKSVDGLQVGAYIEVKDDQSADEGEDTCLRQRRQLNL